MKYSDNRELLIFSLVSFALFAAIVIVAPMAGEDYGLTKIFHNESFIDRMIYAFDKSHAQMAGWNARLGEQLAIYELSMPRWLSLIIYTISFALFSVIVSMLTSLSQPGRWKQVSQYAMALTFLLWPGMEVFFWKTANSGYLQTMLLTMIAIIPYSSRHYLESFKSKRIAYLFYLLACFLAGTSFENVPFAIAISMLILCIWQKRRHLLNYVPVAAILAGWVLLISAHSTFVRRQYYADTVPRNNDPFIHYHDRIKDVVHNFFGTSSLIFVLSLISLVYLSRQKLLNKYHLCIIIASILVVGSMIMSPYTEPRSFLFAWCTMFSLICYAFANATERFQLKNIITVIMFSSVCFGIYTLSIYSAYGEKLNAREEGIINATGTDQCKIGYEISIIKDPHGYRYVNNRDEWYFYNMINKSDYYNCLITNKKN